MEESKRSLQQARAGFCEAGLDPISATGKGPWSEDWNCEDPVRPEIANAIEERQEVTQSRTEEEEKTEEEKKGNKKGDDEDEGGVGVRDRDEEGEETRTPRVGRIPVGPAKKYME